MLPTTQWLTAHLIKSPSAGRMFTDDYNIVFHFSSLITHTLKRRPQLATVPKSPMQKLLPQCPFSNIAMSFSSSGRARDRNGLRCDGCRADDRTVLRD